MKKIIAIVGEAGVGKDTVARILQAEYGCNVICSYTTRPMREGESEGVEHHFTDIVPPKDDMLAYTVYGGYEYWTTKAQLTDMPNVYVIDEEGLCELIRKYGTEYNIIPIYVIASRKTRCSRGISRERMSRDTDRRMLPMDEYRFRIINNGSMERLRKWVESIVNEINNI